MALTVIYAGLNRLLAAERQVACRLTPEQQLATRFAPR